MRVYAFAAALLLAPQALFAACVGPSLLDRLSDAERAALDATTAAVPFGDGLFWTATKEDHQITVIGTMHLPDPRHDAILTAIDPVLTGADLILLEMTPQEEREMQEAIASDTSLVFIDEGPSLPDRLDKATWDALAAAARDRQMPSFLAAKSQPWFLMASLSLPPCAMDDLLGGARGLDQQIMDVAEGAGVPMQALEPWSTLPTLFAEVPLSDQIDMLRLSILGPDIQAEAFVAMLDGYFAGQIAQVWAMSELAANYIDDIDPAATEAAFALTETLMLDGRNAAWMPVIAQASATHDRLVVAAGAAHLIGEGGVLARLQNDGWAIAPYLP